MSRYVDLSEKVTATYYDEQYEEWDHHTVTIEDVLNEVCDDYTVLPTIEPQPEIIRCKDCKHRPTFTEADGYIDGFSLEFPDNVCPCQCKNGWYNWYPSDDFYCGVADRVTG